MITNTEIINKLKDLTLIISMEEMAELQKAISKFLRKKPNMENLHEEYADVLICLEWIKEYCHLEQNEIDNWIKKKKERLQKRYEDGTLS